jgi:hypothetical protein
VSTPGLCSASVDLLQAACDELAAADDVPEAAGAEALALEELLEFELPQAAMSTAARAGSRTAERRSALSKPHNLHPGDGDLSAGTCAQAGPYDEMVMASTDLGICSAGATSPPLRAAMMTHDELRLHIAASVTASRPAELRGLTARIVSVCWPGGHQDRSNPAALAWLRHWRPQRVGAELPVCSCVSGRCAVCN